MEIAARHISKRFGGLNALDDVSVVARAGEVTAVIGPNGAGKSTLINCLCGAFPMTRGEIVIDGCSHTKIGAQELIGLGIARTFQTSRLWEHLTVAEHLRIVAVNYGRSPRAKVDGSVPDIDELLGRFSLVRKRDQLPHELSYGERRRLELARCLASRPKLILLDEPAAGFNLSEQADLAGQIREISGTGVALVLVEHHMDIVATVSSSVVVLNFGKVLMAGTMEEVRNNPNVIAAYLGGAA